MDRACRLFRTAVEKNFVQVRKRGHTADHPTVITVGLQNVFNPCSDLPDPDGIVRPKGGSGVLPTDHRSDNI